MSARPHLCSRCVLPEGFPGLRLDEDGVCGFCQRQPASGQNAIRRAKLREKMEELFAVVEKQPGPHLLMAYSGGKDSTATLARLRRLYGLEVLAVTLDNGFLSDLAMQNVRTVVDRLGVDHLVVRPRTDLTQKIFAAAAKRDLFAPATLARASSVCTACITLVKSSCMRTAIERGIPLIGYGWSPGQAPLASALHRPTVEMLRQGNHVVEEPIVEVVGEAARAWFLNEEHYARPERIPHLVHPLALEEYDERAMLEELKELGWRRPEDVDPNSTNCRLNGLANWAHLQRHPFHPYAYELAGLVREGALDRQEAIQRLEEPTDPASLEEIASELGIDLGEVECAS